MSRILLAEGHGPTCEYVTRSLAEAGLDVAAATSAAGAYELFAGRRPDVVVLAADLDDGTLARRLREADPRVVLVVADREHLGKARGLEAVLPLKANAYVADPTRPELVERVVTLVRQRAGASARLRGLPLVLSRAPAAQGEVKPGVVAHLLHQIWRSLSEGVLVLAGGGAERRVSFARGAPVGFESDDPAESLSRWLVEAGRIDEAAHQAALEGMATGLSPGAALIAAGVIEPGEPLEAVLRAHLEARVVRCVGMKEGRWRFHAGSEVASEARAAILPLRAILDGARAGIPLKHLADALRAVTDAYPVRSGDFPQLLPATSLGSADLRLALALDGRITTREFLDARKADLKDAISLLWFLSMIGAVAFHEVPEVADAAYGKAAPPRRRPLPAERGEALRQAALQILPGTYFHALGLDVAADPGEVERAYREVASRFHPDGFADYEVGELADLLSSVQDKVTAAYRVLSDAEKRRAYLSFLFARLELAGVRRSGLDVDAEIALRRGVRALQARRNAEALGALREAVERNEREPAYLAMLGFGELVDPVLPAAERAQAARRSARRALAIDPEHPRALCVLALAEDALGDPPEARKAVLGALKAHPGSEIAKQVLHRVNRVR